MCFQKINGKKRMLFKGATLSIKTAQDEVVFDFDQVKQPAKKTTEENDRSDEMLYDFKQTLHPSASENEKISEHTHKKRLDMRTR